MTMEFPRNIQSIEHLRILSFNQVSQMYNTLKAVSILIMIKKLIVQKTNKQ